MDDVCNWEGQGPDTLQPHISNCYSRLYHVYSDGTATETEGSENVYTECFLGDSFSLFIDAIKRCHFYIISILWIT